MQKKIKNKKISDGFMMVEVIIAISIIIVSVLVAMSVTQKSVSVARQALHTSEATFLLEEGAEAVRIIRDNSWSDISNLSPGTTYYPIFSGTWALSASPTTVGIFTRTMSITSVNRDNSTQDIAISGTNDAGTKLITITVSWNEGGEVLSKTLSFYIMDIFSA